MWLSLRPVNVATTGDRPASFLTMYKDSGTAKLTFQIWEQCFPEKLWDLWARKIWASGLGAGWVGWCWPPYPWQPIGHRRNSQWSSILASTIWTRITSGSRSRKNCSKLSQREWSPRRASILSIRGRGVGITYRLNVKETRCALPLAKAKWVQTPTLLFLTHVLTSRLVDNVQ